MDGFLTAIRSIDIRKVALALVVLDSLEHGIVVGDVPLTGALPALWIPLIVAWCKILVYVNPFLLAGHSFTAIKWPQASAAAVKALVLFVLAPALMLALLLASPASAQTVTKAPPAAPAVPGYPYASDGFYFGVGSLGMGASSSVAGTDDTSLGAALTGIVGYQWRGGLDFVALENDVYYTNIGSATSCAALPCAVNSEFGVEQRLKFGFPVSTLTALLPNLSSVFPALPTLPSTVVTSNSHPYLMVSLHEDDVSASLGLASAQAWQVQPGVGAGMLSQWTNGLAVDTWAEVSFAGSGFDVISGKPSSANLGTEFRAGVSALY